MLKDRAKVQNILSPRTGRGVPNQFIISTETWEYFQSYRSVIVCRGSGRVILDRNKWDYSRTTGKYRNLFLGETKKETEAKIKAGIYELADLN